MFLRHWGVPGKTRCTTMHVYAPTQPCSLACLLFQTSDIHRRINYMSIHINYPRTKEKGLRQPVSKGAR